MSQAIHEPAVLTVPGSQPLELPIAAATEGSAGADISKLRPDQRAHIGIGWVPQERNIFKSLTVHENLTAVARPGRWNTDKVYSMFPRLKERQNNLGNQLSGGEQQMLAVGRALVSRPRILLVDEMSLGLAPVIVERLLPVVRQYAEDAGCAVLLVEQHIQLALQFANRGYVLAHGEVVLEGGAEQLRGDTQHLVASYLGEEAEGSPAPPSATERPA